jgi:threonine aldolase
MQLQQDQTSRYGHPGGQLTKIKSSPHFTSDNRSGICPEAWEAIAAANESGHQPSYGDDPWTRRAADLIRQIFETDCDVYFVFNGTAANSLALASLCQSYHSVICHEASHIENDECGAPEFFSNGTKLLLAPGPDGKLSPEAVESIVRKRSDIHYPKPRVVSLTQATELGTVYQPAELKELSDRAKCLNLRIQMDGARFANAIASLNCSPAEPSWKSGVDVLCLGGTKNGMLAGDAVVFFDRSLSNEFAFRCKQAGQLASKMRFLTAAWVGMLESGAWLTRAAHANSMARLLEFQLRKLIGKTPSSGLRILFPVQANSVFVESPAAMLEGLRSRGWEAYTFIGNGARFMCSWDTSEQDVESLVADMTDIVAKPK